jgi:hypothetical protein
MSFIGVAIALLLTGTDLSVMALIGMVMLVGIVVNNGIVLVDYINQDVMGVAVVEQAALARYAAVSGDNYISDQRLYDTLKREVVPTFTEYVNVLHRIEPETDAVKQLHATFINGAEYRLRGFQTIMGGIRSQDAQVIRAANNLLEKGALELEKWRIELQQLYATYGIRQKTP